MACVRPIVLRASRAPVGRALRILPSDFSVPAGCSSRSFLSVPRIRIRFPASLVRCAASSLAAVALEFILLTFFVSVLRMHYLVAAIASTAVYLLVTFLLNRRWAFSASGAPAGRQLARHLGVSGVGLGLALVQMRFFIHTVGLPYQLGWAAAGCVNFGAWTWPMSRFFTYRDGREAVVVPCMADGGDAA